jgi:hypothetical protein
MKKIILSIIIAIISMNVYAQKNQKIVVLPYIINIEGNIPQHLSAENIEELQKTKGIFYQAEMIASLNARSNRWRFRKVNPKIITQVDINNSLEEKGYKLAQMANISNAELNSIFPDAKIIRGNLSIYNIMPVQDAMLINTGLSAINNNTRLFIPPVRHTIYNMIVSLENAKNKSIDWSGGGSNSYNAKKIMKFLKRNA